MLALSVFEVCSYASLQPRRSAAGQQCIGQPTQPGIHVRNECGVGISTD